MTGLIEFALWLFGVLCGAFIYKIFSEQRNEFKKLENDREEWKKDWEKVSVKFYTGEPTRLELLKKRRGRKRVIYKRTTNKKNFKKQKKYIHGRIETLRLKLTTQVSAR